MTEFSVEDLVAVSVRYQEARRRMDEASEALFRAQEAVKAAEDSERDALRAVHAAERELLEYLGQPSHFGMESGVPATVTSSSRAVKAR